MIAVKSVPKVIRKEENNDYRWTVKKRIPKLRNKTIHIKLNLVNKMKNTKISTRNTNPFTGLWVPGDIANH